MFKKEGKRSSQENAFNHLTMAPQDTQGFKLLFRKHSSFRILQWHSLFSGTELVWHAGTEYTLSLENITLFTKTCFKTVLVHVQRKETDHDFIVE